MYLLHRGAAHASATPHKHRHVRVGRVLTLIAAVTAVALLFGLVNPPSAQAQTTVGDQVVSVDFEDAELADDLRQELTAIDESGKSLSEVLEEKTEGRLHD